MTRRNSEVTDLSGFDLVALVVEGDVQPVAELGRAVVLPLVVTVIVARQFGGFLGAVGVDGGDVVSEGVNAAQDLEGGHGGSPKRE